METIGWLKGRTGVGKGAEACTVNRGLSKIPSLAGILSQGGKIEEVWVELHLKIDLDLEGP